MIIQFHKQFEKQYKKLTPHLKLQFKEKISIFTENPYNTVLNNHPLKGRYLNYRSINITGDFRAIYKQITSEKVVLLQ